MLDSGDQLDNIVDFLLIVDSALTESGVLDLDLFIK